MPNPPRPNRPTPRAGATDQNPQAEGAPRTGRAEQTVGTDTAQQQIGPQLGQAGAQGAAASGTAGALGAGLSSMHGTDLWQLAQWAVTPPNDDEDAYYRREQVRAILHRLVDEMVPE